MAKIFHSNCPAKINIFLKLISERPDGHQNLESLFAFLDLNDDLIVKESDQFSINFTGEFGKFVDPTNNLFTKILNFFSEKFGVSKNLAIKICKNIPVGAGLGGGSSNAAYFMMSLNEIFALNLSKKELQEISLNFGSDIAFFFEDRAAIIKGRGEIIEKFPAFPAVDALLINPKISVSTQEVFQKFCHNKIHYSPEIPTAKLLKKGIFELIKGFANDLQKPAISICPVILEILAELKNCRAITAKMSGSGASCFAIFHDVNDLELAMKIFADKFPNFFVRKVKILSEINLAA